MSLTEVKIRARALRLGMFVCRLDRPWLETPFPIQGFMVRAPEQVEQVRRFCEFVFVDITRGEAPDRGHIVHDDGVRPDPVSVAEIDQLRHTTYDERTDIREEFSAASKTYEHLNEQISEVLTDLRHGKKLDLERLAEGVNAMIDSILRCPDAFACLTDLKRKDVYSYRHSLGTSVWAATLGRHLGMERPAMQKLALGGLLLDVGKTRIPQELLNDEDRLSEDAIMIMRTHVQHSVDILSETSAADDQVIEMVATHHERWDGGGYPSGLREREIPLFGRIAGIVDTYDALTSERRYAEALSPHSAVNLLYEWRGVDYQNELVEQFIQAVGIFPTGTLVELSTGEVGVVISLNGIRRLQPRIMVLLDAEKQPLAEFFEVDLMERAKAGDRSISIRRGLPPSAYGIDPEDFYL
ncbi:MAG: HD-GYP domain-containing protein [Pseudomonadota bacterium]